MNTTQLRCFLMVAETLNFAKAARHLNVTQPAVTQQIHSLEEELNVKLFNRTTRTVELTKSGLMFMSDAKSILDIAARAKKKMGNSFEDVRKEFVLGCHAHNEIYQFSEVFQRMHEAIPQIYPIFQVIPFRHLYQQLVEQRLDAVAAFQESDLKEYLLYRELMQVPAMAVAAKDSALTQKSELYMDDLKQEKVIIIDPRKWKCSGALGKILYQVMENRSALDMYLCESAESAIALARAGFGVTIIPGNFPAKDPSLFYRPLLDAKPMSYGIYYKKGKSRKELRTFLTLAKEYFSSQDSHQTE